MPAFPYVKSKITVIVLETKEGTEDTDPIEDSRISVDFGAPKKTDKDGKVVLWLFPGIYSIRAEALGQDEVVPWMTKPEGGEETVRFWFAKK